ncbi:MAG: hypothetical protein ACRCUI_13100 [Polymorphobacter sp.]
MTPAARRLARLHAVRRVRLQAASRRLALATHTVLQLQTTTARIERLRDDLGLQAPLLSGYEAKAIDAARALLGAANLRQRQRIEAAEVRRRAAADEVNTDRAAADAVERALERAAEVARRGSGS